MKSTENNAFLNEALDTLNRIYKENKHLSRLRWFLDAALQRFNKDHLSSRTPRVIVLGDDIPAELLAEVSARRIGRTSSRREIPIRSAVPLSAGLSISSLISRKTP